jgi:hypothetical protein
MSTSAFCVRESGCYWTVVEAGVVRGCVASREQAQVLVGILQAMADARSTSAAYQHEVA